MSRSEASLVIGASGGIGAALASALGDGTLSYIDWEGKTIPW